MRAELRGVINFRDHIAMSFSQFLNAPKLIPGCIGFISQSGALGGSLLNKAQDVGVGFSTFISAGNEATLDFSDFVQYLVADDETKLIIGIVEGIRDGDKFLKAAHEALSKDKPIIILKLGKTEVGRGAAHSHTGSMAGSDIVYEAVFKQSGVIRVESLDDLYVVGSAFLKSIRPKGKRVGVLTSTGGGGVILADKLIEAGLELPDLSLQSKEELKKVVPSFVSIKNPLDLTAQLINDPMLFGRCIETFTNNDNFDSVVIATSMVAGDASIKRANLIIEAAQKASKPMMTWWAAGSLSRPGMELLEKSSVPFFTSPEACVNSLRCLSFFSEIIKSSGEADVPLTFVSEEKRASTIAALSITDRFVTEEKGKQILAQYGISTTREKLAEDLDKAKLCAKEIGYPVALKVVSPDLPHKTEAGVIRLNVMGEKELEKGYKEILENAHTFCPEVRVLGVLVQEMIPEGLEMIIGAKVDPQFGPVVMCGMGGIFAEIFHEFSLRRAPIGKKDVRGMLSELKAHKILLGARGNDSCDVEEIIRTTLAVSQIIVEFQKEIVEIDLNPVKVFSEGKGVKCIDCLIVKR